MNWNKKTVAPSRRQPAKFRVRDSCPGICRFSGMVSSLCAGLGLFYGGSAILGLEPLNMSSPNWTTLHVCLAVASLLLAMIAAFFGFALALAIQVRNERMNDLLTVLWHFLAYGSMVWLMTIGTTMSITMGQEQAKAAVLSYGVERSAVLLLGVGSIAGLLLGFIYVLVPMLRLSFFAYIVWPLVVSMLATQFHFRSFELKAESWIVVVAIVVFPILVFVAASSMIERDRQHRKLLLEQSSMNREDEHV